MSAAARGAAGYLYASGRMRARREDRTRLQAEQHLRRFVSAERAKELAAEAVKVTHKKRRTFSTAP